MGVVGVDHALRLLLRLGRSFDVDLFNPRLVRLLRVPHTCDGARAGRLVSRPASLGEALPPLAPRGCHLHERAVRNEKFGIVIPAPVGESWSVATDTQKPTTLYRYGQRNPTTRTGHNAYSRGYRREIADAVLGPDVRAHLLEQIRSGTPLPVAARAVGRTPAQVHGRARWDPEFRKLLDDALEEYSAPYKGEHCGTPTGYRYQCRCKPCRRAHAEETDRYR